MMTSIFRGVLFTTYIEYGGSLGQNTNNVSPTKIFVPLFDNIEYWSHISYTNEKWKEDNQKGS